MKICIVNPGRCGGTLMLCYLHSKLPGYNILYEAIENVLPPDENIIFKYQYLYTHKPLEGADKYIICDRKDKDAWLFSTYMSAVNKHHHGLVTGTFKFNESDYNHSKLGMSKVYDEAWVPERERLLKAGADMVWYEDMKIKEDVYFRGTKLVPVWSCKRK
jgi:hypothetical protein